MSEIVRPKTLAGFQDVLPSEAIVKTKIIDTVKEVFSSFGFVPIETPHLEYTEVLMPQAAGEIEKQLYRFKDNGERDVCLRFDLTVPFARFLVQHKNELGLPFKRYAIGSCFRGESPQYGRLREFTQCDFDIVGVNSVCADSEILQAIVTCFKKLGLENFTTRVSNRKLLSGLAEFVGLDNKAIELIRIIDKKLKITSEKFEQLLEKELSCSPDQIKQILEFINLSNSSNEDTLEKLSEYTDKNDLFNQGVSELKTMFSIVNEIEGVTDNVKIDLSLARGLGYYTGHIFETILNDCPEVGSVSGGGRYDNLTMSYEKQQTCGVGASIGVTRILAALEKLNLNKKISTTAKLLVTLFDINLAGQVYTIADKLRQHKINVEVYPDADKLKKQFQYADRKGFDYVLILGPDELETSEFTLKDMKTGKEQKILGIEMLINLLSI